MIEDLPFEERVSVVSQIADALVELLRRAGGHMDLMDALRAAAAKFQTLISQIRYGLDYAIAHHRVSLDDRTLSLA